MKRTKILESGSYITLIALSGILIVKQFYPSQAAYPAPPQRPPSMEVGEQYEALKTAVPEESEKTLILAVSPTCPYCEKSMPFFKELLQERDQKAEGLSIIAAVGHTSLTAAETIKLETEGVKVDKLMELDFEALKIIGVPAMVLVNKEGEVEGFWEGYLDEEKQAKAMKDILSAISD